MSRVVWFHPRPWGPPQGGGDLRSQGLVDCAAEAGHEVLLVAPAGAVAPRSRPGVVVRTYAEPRGMMLAAAKAVSRHPLRSPRVTRHEFRRLGHEIAAFAPDLAVVSEVMGWSAAQGLLPTGLPLVYDAHNVEAPLFRALAADAESAFDRVTLGVDARRVAQAETALLARAAAVLTVSWGEAERLERLAPDQRFVVVPSSVATPAEVARPAAAEATVLFAGTLDYGPNIAAVRELVEEVLPIVRRTAPARLRVVGRRATVEVRGLAAPSWVELVEDAPDMGPHYRSARCTVLPIRSGAGTKLKVYESLAWGLPVIATPEALAGIEIRDGEALVATDAAGLAAHAISVLTDDVIAQGLGDRARAAFDGRLSWASASAAALDQILRTVAGHED